MLVTALACERRRLFIADGKGRSHSRSCSMSGGIRFTAFPCSWIKLKLTRRWRERPVDVGIYNRMWRHRRPVAVRFKQSRRAFEGTGRMGLLNRLGFGNAVEGWWPEVCPGWGSWRRCGGVIGHVGEILIRGWLRQRRDGGVAYLHLRLRRRLRKRDLGRRAPLGRGCEGGVP